MTRKFQITGMSCAACSACIEKMVGRLAGVGSVAVNLLMNSMTVDFDKNLLTEQQIIQTVIDTGCGGASQSARLMRKNPQFQPHILFSSRRKENVPLTVQEKRAAGGAVRARWYFRPGESTQCPLGRFDAPSRPKSRLRRLASKRACGRSQTPDDSSWGP